MGYFQKGELQNVKKGLLFAKENPEDPKAQEIERRLRAGQLNFELKALGLNPVPIKQPKIDMQAAFKGVQMQEGQQSMIPEKKAPSDAKQDIQEGIQQLQQVVPTRGAAASEDIKNMGSFKTFGQGGFGAVAQGVGALFDTAGIFAKTAAKLALSQEQEDRWKRGLEKAASNPFIATPIEKVTAALDVVRESDPELANSIGDAMTLSEFLVGGSKPVRAGIEAGVDATKQGGQAVVRAGEATQQGFQTAAKTVGEAVDSYQARKLPERVAAQQEKVDTAVARILQGKPEDVAQGKKALSLIDTTDVKTYEDLNLKISDRLTALRNQQDELLSQDTNVIPEEQFGVYKSVNGELVITTPVVDGLEQLADFYRKTNDAVNAKRIEQQMSKLDGTGLTLKEVNDIAREHGQALNAFNANGQLASGLSKQAAENTRKGLKDAVRSRLETDAAKEIDSQMSALLSTQKLTTDVEVKVSKLYNRIKNRTLAQKVGGAAAQLVDLATFGTLRGFVAKILPSNVGNKAMNSIEIEAELQKNLKELDTLLEMQDDAKFAAAFEEWAKNIQPGLSTRSTVTPLSVGSRLTEPEFDLMADAIEDLRSAKMNPDFNEMLQKYGLSNAEEDELIRFMKEATDQFERPETTFTPNEISGKAQSATTETTDLILKEEAKKYTARPITYAHNPNRDFSEEFSKQFASDIEPAGKYVNLEVSTSNKLEGVEYGEVTMKNPLILEWKTSREGGWKSDLSDMYEGKTGKDLSEAIKADGYDAVITIHNGNPAEAVLFSQTTTQQ